VEKHVEHRRQLSKQADCLIEKIRLRPGFDRFLKVPLFKKLAQAAADGVVVALISSDPVYVAIVIRADDDPQSVPLFSVNRKTLSGLVNEVHGSGMRDHACLPMIEEHDAQRVTRTRQQQSRKPWQ
jgi:hypothetical protein